MSLLTGSANTIKYVLFAFNLIFLITGIILIAVGVGVASVFYSYEVLLASNFFSIPTFLIVIGVFIIFISFFGCWGALRENYCLTLIFAILLGLIFILELAAGISGYVLRSDAEQLLESSLKGSLTLYQKNQPTDSYTHIWDYVQSTFDCCGVNSYKDWTQFNGSLPLSCCTIPYGVVGSYECGTTNETTERHTNGCLLKFSTFIEAHAVSLGACGIVLAVIQFFGVLFACYIAREIKIRNGISGFMG
ncbi:CD63 antigen [Ceratitis capitata]|uniref:Tetraspanin n=1 Tax=Ceratitis capitata TaxID=7213 RepID=W8C0N6_CERCA|nr:CD63 antigen [Ceratitis capitata]XP_004527266.1 CD63 antigen [Ceratitis capitata]XP_012158282.1 CD63 antigen [Ceratitis capitata]